MQFQSDILNLPILVPNREELSGIGCAYLAGIALGIYNRKKLFSREIHTQYSPSMDKEVRTQKKEGWKAALGMIT